MSTGISFAQEDNQRPEGNPMPRRPMPPPLMAVLDADHDGKISADEIKNASNALAALDKNGDGEVTADEAFGPRPQQRPQPDQEGPPPGRRPQGPPPGEGKRDFPNQRQR